MNKKRVLTGITTTGSPHIGNYLGAIKPAIAASRDSQYESFYFLADFHALIKCHDPERVAQSSREIAATWLALGLDTDASTFYRQSDVPEIPELTWLLTCLCSKGLMNRSHAYKAAVDANKLNGTEDLDADINMGLFSYPILMAADILMFNADLIPVGKDQIQHIEMARDLAGRFNHTYAPVFTLPEAWVDEQTQLIPGLDGRKMSKSYDNTIPLFCSSAELKKHINAIQTDMRLPGEAKDTDSSTLFQLYSCFANEQEQQAMRQQFEQGIAWGDAKQQLFEFIDDKLSVPRARYQELMTNPAEIEAVLQKGAKKARAETMPLLSKLRQLVGIRPLDQAATIKEQSKGKKEIDPAQQAKAEEGIRRAILQQLQPLLEQVKNSADPGLAAQNLLVEKQVKLESLKKKAKQKGENEFAVLKEALDSFLTEGS